MDDLAGIPLNGLTAPALLGLAILLLLLGKLIPRRTYEDLKDDRDRWREAHDKSESARKELLGTLDELLEHARTTESFIRSLPSRVDQDRP